MLQRTFSTSRFTIQASPFARWRTAPLALGLALLAACSNSDGGTLRGEEPGEEGDPPVAALTGSPTSGNAPLSVQFSDASTGTVTSWAWNFGDGATSSLENPVHVYTSAGLYTVSLTATGPDGSDTVVRPDYIDASTPPPPPPGPPTASLFGTPTSGNVPLTVQFSDFSSGQVSSWSWSFGDGGSSNAQNPSHTYTNAGTYTVSLTVTGPGGSDTDTRGGYVNASAPPPPDPPVASFVGTPTSGEAPLQVAFIDLSTGSVSSWSWSFGDGGSSNAQNPTHVYNAPGTYTVSLTATGPGGSSTDTKGGYVTADVVVPAPTAEFTGTPRTGDAPLTVQFSDQTTGNVTSWSWTFGDGGTSTAQNPSHVYASAGTYDVRLTSTGPGGADTIQKPGYVTADAVAQPPTAAFAASPTSGVAPLAVQFTDQSTGGVTSWAWDFGDGASSSQQSPSHSYGTAGTYTVSLTVTSPNGSDTLTRTDLITAALAGTCNAGNARFNNANELKLGYDWVPLTDDDSASMYVVYSGKANTSGSGLANTVNIFLLPLDNNEVLIFGGGYGDPFAPGTALNDAAFDADNTDECLQGCMGMTPQTHTLRFLVPHGHGDHINPPYVREMKARGWLVSEITYHASDASSTQGMSGWTSEDLAVMNSISGSTCNQELKSYSSPNGKLWAIPRSGHTPGSIDLMLDVHDDTSDRILMLGSAPGGSCPAAPSGTRTTFKAHGTPVVP